LIQFAGTRGICCSCGEWGGDFFDVVKNAQIVVLATMERQGITGRSIKVSIKEVFAGKTKKTITIGCDNGIQCRPYANLFTENQSYYLAIHKSSRGELSLSSCGEYFVKVESDFVKSFGHYSHGKKRIEEMTVADFETRLRKDLPAQVNKP